MKKDKDEIKDLKEQIRALKKKGFSKKEAYRIWEAVETLQELLSSDKLMS